MPWQGATEKENFDAEPARSQKPIVESWLLVEWVQKLNFYNCTKQPQLKQLLVGKELP